MKILLVGDIHLADRPPSVRRETYADEVLAKIEFTVQVADDQDVDAVVWAGDVFHIKAPSRTSHRLVQRTAEIGQSYGRPWLIVPGNHDLRHDDLETLDSQPLGTLFKAGATPLIGQPDPSLPVFGIPFLPSWERDLDAWMRRWSETEAELLVTHAPIVVPGREMPYEVIDAEAWLNMMARGGAVYFGHMHDCDGSFKVQGDIAVEWFANQGALSRGSLHENSLARKPAVTVYETRTDGDDPFTRIEVPHKPAEEVFRLSEHQSEQDKLQRLDEFLGAVGTTSFERLTVEAVVEHARSLGLSQPTMTQITECIEHAMSEVGA